MLNGCIAQSHIAHEDTRFRGISRSGRSWKMTGSAPLSAVAGTSGVPPVVFVMSRTLARHAVAPVKRAQPAAACNSRDAAAIGASR